MEYQIPSKPGVRPNKSRGFIRAINLNSTSGAAFIAGGLELAFFGSTPLGAGGLVGAENPLNFNHAMKGQDWFQNLFNVYHPWN